MGCRNTWNDRTQRPTFYPDKYNSCPMQPKVNLPLSSPFQDIRNYVSSLRALVAELLNGEAWNSRCNAALDGEASRELRRIAPLDVRREFGVFFTGMKLSSALIAQCSNFGDKSVFFDPTCGMGDLLLAIARLLPLATTLDKTLENWGRQLSGTDLHSEFVDGAKARLSLLARQRHGLGGEAVDLSVDYFPLIQVADALAEKAAFDRATHVLMNPPFGLIHSSGDHKWGSGRMSAAALFICTTLERIRPGTEVLAILPDVLRSGSNFHHWRNTVAEFAEVRLIKSFGVFDDSADIDVFLLHLMRRLSDVAGGNEATWPQSQRGETTISDVFSVSVGRVVPYRDELQGALHSYIHPRGVAPWAVMTEFSESRKHSAPPFLPPFVVIRRTSRPEQPYRATATVISGNEPVFVENHLIVCRPHDGSLNACEDLMRQLKTDSVNDFLNSRIRCRHLTVRAIRDLPIEMLV